MASPPTSSAPAATREELVDELRELWLTESDLSFLATVDDATLGRVVTEVREHAARVHEGQRRLYEVLAHSTRALPNFLVTKLAATLSPYVLAQVSEHLEPKAAASLAKTFDTHLLADIVLHIDTHTAAGIATHLDVDMLVNITSSLANKGLNKRLGEVSDALDERMLEKLVVRIADPRRIAAIASHMHQLDKLGRIAARLDARLVAGVVELLLGSGHEQSARAMQRRS